MDLIKNGSYESVERIHDTMVLALIKITHIPHSPGRLLHLERPLNCLSIRVALQTSCILLVQHFRFEEDRNHETQLYYNISSPPLPGSICQKPNRYYVIMVTSLHA